MKPKSNEPGPGDGVNMQAGKSEIISGRTAYALLHFRFIPWQYWFLPVRANGGANFNVSPKERSTLSFGKACLDHVGNDLDDGLPLGLSERFGAHQEPAQWEKE